MKPRFPARALASACAKPAAFLFACFAASASRAGAQAVPLLAALWRQGGAAAPAPAPGKHGWAAWTLRMMHRLASLGAPGIFLLAFLDSSVLSFPVVVDLLIMEESISRPSRMPYFVLMGVAGSLAGCIWLYWLARKGGEAFYKKLNRRSGKRLEQWMERNAFVCVFAASVLPPPMPFKPFIILAGILEVRTRTFVASIVSGRGVRYLLEGWLAVHYGAWAIHFVMAHKWRFVAIALAATALILASNWLINRPERAKA